VQHVGAEGLLLLSRRRVAHDCTIGTVKSATADDFSVLLAAPLPLRASLSGAATAREATGVCINALSASTAAVGLAQQVPLDQPAACWQMQSTAAFCHMLSMIVYSRAGEHLPFHCVQTASGRAFKPQWLAAASVQLAAGATRLRAQSVAGGTAKFSGMAVLKGRSSAQLLGAYVDPGVGSQKLCLAVGLDHNLLLLAYVCRQYVLGGCV
jgi:hypothetical protein